MLGSMGKKKDLGSTTTAAAGASPLGNNPFGALAGLRAALPTAASVGDSTTDSAVKAAAGRLAVAATLAPPTRAVVRYERAGRGGKEATLIEKLELDAAELERWCRELKASLGCGGAVQDDAIVLQGDQRKRLPALLERRGVKKITVA